MTEGQEETTAAPSAEVPAEVPVEAPVSGVPAASTPDLAPPPEAEPSPVPTRWEHFRRSLHDYFFGEHPTFAVALVPFCVVSMLLFTRHPLKTNFIFDEQEALLANPFVRSVADPKSKFGWADAFVRDFWGLGPERSIGSYRPIPNLVWRALWALGAREQTPFLHHWVNIIFHGLNGALVCVLAMRLVKNKNAAWLAGAAFTASAVLTEAVSGVVGIADVLGATGALLALLALATPMPWMGVLVFWATLFGLYSKESALCIVPLVPMTALLTAQLMHPERPRRWTRATVAAIAAIAAFVLYVEARRRMFPAALPPEVSVEANAGKPLATRVFAAMLRWYAQPSLPKDPLNNPLVNAPGPLRVAGALRVYLSGLGQVVFPWTLSGDYSSPQEPVPATAVNPTSILGGLAMVLPFPLAAILGFASWSRWRKAEHPAPAPRASWQTWLLVGGPIMAFAPILALVPRFWLGPWWSLALAAVVFAIGGALVWVGIRKRHAADPTGVHGVAMFGAAPPVEAKVDVRPVIAAALLWVTISYFPVSNIPVLLPTVRAERFWYFPVIGTSLVLGILFAKLLEKLQEKKLEVVAYVALAAFFGLQMVSARLHANDYTDDLTFWAATRKAVPRSAKAHLNYSVMKGARGDLPARLDANRTAFELAPQWPMASTYLGDTLCRMHRAHEAWPHYVRGFELAPNDVNLIGLALQCLWDEKVLQEDTKIRQELESVAAKYPGSWLDYLAKDVLEHGEEHKGVDPKYRPRGYNEGPKE